MKRFPSFVTISLFALLVVVASCDSAERALRRGHQAMALGEYCEAAAQYRLAYQRTPSSARQERGEAAALMADAYRRYGASARALGAYRSAIRYGKTDSLIYFHAAEMMRCNGAFADAANYYRLYLDSVPDDTLAILGLQAAQTAADFKEQGSLYAVRLEALFSSSRSDYCPALLGEGDEAQLFFSSSRNESTGDDYDGVTGTMAGDIYFSRKDERGKWQRPNAVEGNVNTEFDEGACSFAPDGSKMYLTVCRTDVSYPRQAEIWVADRADATWNAPKQLVISADTLSSYAHPACAPDGTWLYFVSDMPGGYGGYDLWRSTLIDGKVGIIENLGPTINTAGNELFPAFGPSGELYFSSDGRGGMGGLDLYYATEDTIVHTWEVSHLPYPMNSEADDFGITFDGAHNRGFFASSRSTGGRGWDKIYSFSYPEVLQTVKGWVYEQDGYELPQAVVYMVGSDGTNLRLSVLSDGSFTQPVGAGVDYLFLATCPGYLNVSTELVADTAEIEEEHVLQFPLPRIDQPVLVRNVFYEFDRAELTTESEEALDRLIKLLEENPHVTIELSAHCDYRGTDEYNDDLSQRRSQSVVDYLIAGGIATDRLTAKGYGEKRPKVVNRKLTETYKYLSEGDTLTEAYILALDSLRQEECNALNRRTEFHVLSTTYGLFDEEGNLRPDALQLYFKRNRQAGAATDENGDPILDNEAASDIDDELIVIDTEGFLDF